MGFPMIMTSAVFAGVIVYNLGLVTGLIAILLGNVVLMGYVGTLSYIAGRSGKNFALTAADTFGVRGCRIVTAFLSTLVIGWFAFQTGMVGATLNASMGWSARWMIALAGALFVALTFIGIRAISWIGLTGSIMFAVLAAVAVVIAAKNAALNSALSYQGGSGTHTVSFGMAVTMVIAGFADSGTMTADFTRWSKNGRQAAFAAFTAFPLAYFTAELVGALIVALGAAAPPAAVNGGDFLHVLVNNRGILIAAGVVFVFVNLGSVAAHCLYNGSLGFGNITGKTMRQLTVALGVIGTTAAVAGIWPYFATWLNVLGILVPPIGVVLILDQLVFADHRSPDRAGVYVKPFAAWAIGAAVALTAHFLAPELCDAIVAMAVSGIIFAALTYRRAWSIPTAAGQFTTQPALTEESA
jgi:cytosine permease